MWFWAGFAGGAVAGDEGFVGGIGLEDCVSVEAFVNLFDFLIDDGQEVAGTTADDADVNFALVVMLDDFGAGGSFTQNDAGFPDGGGGGF